MTSEEILIGTALLGSALVAGIFFAFSAFVMKALAEIPSRQGIAAMQSINVVVINPMFLGAFFGTAATCLVVVLQSLDRSGAERIYLVAGSALYIIMHS